MELYNLQDNALTTLDTLKVALGLDINGSTTDDPKYIMLINTYSDWAEKVLGRTFKQSEYTESYAAPNGQVLLLDNYPIIEVSSITVDNGEDIDVEDVEYYTKERRGLFKNDGWPSAGVYAHMTPTELYRARNIHITYTAGYIMPNDVNPPNVVRSLPYDLERAIVNIICIDLAQEGTAKGLSSFSISDVTWNFNIPTDLKALHEISPKDYAILRNYRSGIL